MLPSKATKLEWLKQEIPSQALLHPLYLVSFITGFLDPGTYGAFGTFASNQTGTCYLSGQLKLTAYRRHLSTSGRLTGNVILLTLVLASASDIQIHNTVASLLSYLVTGFVFGQIGQHVGVRRRWWLLASFTFQAAILVITCLLESSSSIKSSDRRSQWIYLILLAASSGPQVAIARNCGNGEVPTAMLSSPMRVVVAVRAERRQPWADTVDRDVHRIDLITDRDLLKLAWSQNPALKPRNTRIVYISSLIVGSLAGAFAFQHAGFLVIVAVSAGVKAVIPLWLSLISGTTEAPQGLAILPTHNKSTEDASSRPAP